MSEGRTADGELVCPFCGVILADNLVRGEGVVTCSVKCLDAFQVREALTKRGTVSLEIDGTTYDFELPNPEEVTAEEMAEIMNDQAPPGVDVHVQGGDTIIFNVSSAVHVTGTMTITPLSGSATKDQS